MSEEKPFGGQEIRLENPVAKHFPAFLIGNAAEYEKRFPPKSPRSFWIPRNDGGQFRLPYCDKVVQKDSGKGQTVIICGAGPSLAEEADEWIPKGDQVWGCNSALTWLYENGYPVTHGFTIDQTPEMLEEWHTMPEVEYLLASTVHPHLTDMLLSAGRTVTFFHNYVGIKEDPVSWPDENGVTRTEPWEDWAYQVMYEGTVRAGSGLNAVPRAIDVALFMGFDEIIVLGADCCIRFNGPPPEGKGPGDPEFLAWLREQTVMHADGGHALASNATPVVMVGEIDGRLFAVKPDLAVTAVWLVVMRRALKGRLKIIGDGYVNALKHKSNSFLRRLPNLGGDIPSFEDVTQHEPEIAA
jgi:hypothetical protein